MRNYNLGFISDADIYEHVRNTVKSYCREITLADFNQNIVDPIKLTFDAKVYGKSIEQAIADECFRQIDKSNGNRIGYFHQNIFNYAGNGWTVPKQGFDVENLGLHIFVKLTGRQDTMTETSLRKTNMKMQSKLLEDDEAVCYLVEILSKESTDEAWERPLDDKTCSHKRIRRISLDKFYELVFGDATAFYKLCMALPQIIEDVTSGDVRTSPEELVFDELSLWHSDFLKALYIHTFSGYNGFHSLKSLNNVNKKGCCISK